MSKCDACNAPCDDGGEPVLCDVCWDELVRSGWLVEEVLSEVHQEDGSGNQGCLS